MAQRSKKEVFEYLQRAEVAAVGISNMGTLRQRMMHFGADEHFNIYVSSMKGDPKIIQWSNIPETALLIHQGPTFMEMEECEIIGRAEVIRTKEERKKIVELMNLRSPIVAKNILIILFTTAYSIIAILPILGFAPYTLYFAFLSIPFAAQAIHYVQLNYDKTPVDLIPGNAHTAIAHLFAGLLLVFAFLMKGTGFILPVLYFAASVLLVMWVWNYIERKRKDMDHFRLAFK